MIPYLVLATFPLFASVLVITDDEHKYYEKKTFYVLCFFAFALFLALRSKYLGSTDTYNYCDNFKKAVRATSFAKYSNLDEQEYGYQVFVWILSRLFKNPQWLLVVSGAFISFSAIYFIYKNSKDPALSLTLYTTVALLMFNMQGMRQAMAMSICLFAFECAKKNKLIPFLLLVALASTFHRTAVVFLPVYFLPKVKYSAVGLIFIIVGSALAIYMSRYVIDIANTLFSLQIKRTYDTAVERGGYIVLFIHLFTVFSTLLYEKDLRDDETLHPIFYITLVGCVCYMMRYFGAREAERISFYFLYGEVVLMPNTMSKVEGSLGTILKMCIYIMAILLFIYKLRDNNFLPYEFFWQVD